MISVDSSTWIAFSQDNRGEDVEQLDIALRERQALMAPTVLTEMLSDQDFPQVSEALEELPLIEMTPGYWQRAGALRAIGTSGLFAAAADLDLPLGQ